MSQVNPYRAPNDGAIASSDDPLREKSVSLGDIVFCIGLFFFVISCCAIWIRNFPPLGPMIISLVCFALTMTFSQKHRRRSAGFLLLTTFVAAATIAMLRSRRAQEIELARMRAAEMARVVPPSRSK